MSSRGISVIIPNYNGVELLPKILPALYAALKFAGLPNEVIIADDASTDSSVDHLKNTFPEARVIVNEKNLGFAPTVNKGLAVAQFDYVLLLNSDVKLNENYFPPLLRYFEREDTFGVMGRIIGWDDDSVQDTAKFPSFHGAKIKTAGNYFSQSPKPDDWLCSMYLSGANAFIDRKKLVALGGLDEIFAPFYVEDFEMSLRAWRMGWKCYYEHFAICRHKVSVTIKSKNRKAFINAIYYRNKMYLHAIHLDGWQRFLWHAQLIPETIIRLLTFRFYYLEALRMFLSNREAIKRSKEKFLLLAKQNGKIISVKDVVKTIRTSLGKSRISRF